VLIGRPRQHGMSIVELTIAISLAAVLMAVAAPSLVTGNQNRQVRNAAGALENGLTVARTEALRRNRNVKFSLLSPQGSWSVGCETPDATVVNGEVSCPDVIRTRDAGDGSVQARVDPAEVAATGASAGSTAFSASGNLTFTPMGRVSTSGMAPTLGNGNTAVYAVGRPVGTCANAGGEIRCLEIHVTAAGQIRTCDPAVTRVGDPRAC
jgi:type IV fimbrial biogenesis protein FimT